MELAPPLKQSNSGFHNILGLLLAIIKFLSASLVAHKNLIEQLKKENLELTVRLNKVNQVFAPKNEQSTDDKNEDTEKKKKGGQKGHKPTTRNIPKDLEQKEVILDFNARPCCDVCQKPYKPYTTFDKISHQVQVTLSAIHEIIIRRSYKKDCNCSGSPKIKTAPQRDSLIKKSILTTASWVNLIIMKYFLAVPVYRYAQVLKSMGYKLSPGTVENGFKKTGLLLEPIYRALIIELRKNPLWNADETRWKVFEAKENKKGFLWWLWVFASQKVVIYVIDPTRSASVIDKINGGLFRIFTADRFSSYEAIKKKGDVLIAYCWVHLRRDFINLRSQKIFKNNPDIGKWVDDWLAQIKMVFKLNNQRLKTTSSEGFTKLTAQLCSIVDKLRLQKEDALEYKFQKNILKSFKKRFSGYTIFINQPEVPLHNNRAEQLLKLPISGRNNYLGNVSSKSVKHTQIFLSIIATAKINGVAPQTWLSDYLEACASNSSKALEGEMLKKYVDKLLNHPS
jgi:transposase